MNAAHRIPAVAHYLMRHSGGGGGGGGGGASERRGLRAINNAGENEQRSGGGGDEERAGEREGGSGRVKQSRTRGKCAPIHTPFSLRIAAIEDHVSNQREDTERGRALIGKFIHPR